MVRCRVDRARRTRHPRSRLDLRRDESRLTRATFALAVSVDVTSPLSAARSASARSMSSPRSPSAGSTGAMTAASCSPSVLPVPGASFRLMLPRADLRLSLGAGSALASASHIARKSSRLRAGLPPAGSQAGTSGQGGHPMPRILNTSTDPSESEAMSLARAPTSGQAHRGRESARHFDVVRSRSQERRDL
jgi:hypothetical protein